MALPRRKHDLERLLAYARSEQDRRIGRDLETHRDPDNSPGSSHMKRNAQERLSPEASLFQKPMAGAEGNRKGRGNYRLWELSCPLREDPSPNGRKRRHWGGHFSLSPPSPDVTPGVLRCQDAPWISSSPDISHPCHPSRGSSDKQKGTESPRIPSPSFFSFSAEIQIRGRSLRSLPSGSGRRSRWQRRRSFRLRWRRFRPTSGWPPRHGWHRHRPQRSRP